MKEDLEKLANSTVEELGAGGESSAKGEAAGEERAGEEATGEADGGEADFPEVEGEKAARSRG